jgi:hypothetical protein
MRTQRSPTRRLIVGRRAKQTALIVGARKPRGGEAGKSPPRISPPQVRAELQIENTSNKIEGRYKVATVGAGDAVPDSSTRLPLRLWRNGGSLERRRRTRRRRGGAGGRMRPAGCCWRSLSGGEL